MKILELKIEGAQNSLFFRKLRLFLKIKDVHISWKLLEPAYKVQNLFAACKIFFPQTGVFPRISGLKLFAKNV